CCGFPVATRAVTEWFPVKERATAIGIINWGTAVVAVASPPMIAAILVFANWRWIFFLTRAIEALWTIWWRISYFVPDVEAGGEGQSQSIERLSLVENLRWSSLLRIRETWCLVFAKFLSDAAWY